MMRVSRDNVPVITDHLGRSFVNHGIDQEFKRVPFSGRAVMLMVMRRVTATAMGMTAAVGVTQRGEGRGRRVLGRMMVVVVMATSSSPVSHERRGRRKGWGMAATGIHFDLKGVGVGPMEY